MNKYIGGNSLRPYNYAFLLKIPPMNFGVITESCLHQYCCNVLMVNFYFLLPFYSY